MIDSNGFGSLRAIGLTPEMALRVQALGDLPSADGNQLPMRVTEVQREGLTLHDGTVPHPARLLPALRHALDAEGDAVAVGDWVVAERNVHDEWWARWRVPPLNQLARRLNDGRDKTERAVIASNVDTALLVMGLDNDYNLRRLERYVALVRMAGVRSVVVLTKKDLCADAAGRLTAVRSMLPTGTVVVALDLLIDDATAVLAPWLQPGSTLVLLGSSGAGKSTLTNALTRSLSATAVQAVGGNRDGDNRGRHTTTSRSLHTTVEGACIIDTPGLRTLRLDGDAERLDAVYDDIATLAAHCRFRDCSHGSEPGCAVREAVSPERLHGFGKLLREARRDSQTALERRAQVQQWKVRGRASKIRIAAKRSA
ncbi:MAG: ribosome small subunit-dependent GTPase A [Pseudomonadota bacterium]|nr:ribosome small subunit-dependent GTPase A [Pseudomonadota bacterium]